jgi:hypothetical protein
MFLDCNILHSDVLILSKARNERKLCPLLIFFVSLTVNVAKMTILSKGLENLN